MPVLLGTGALAYSFRGLTPDHCRRHLINEGYGRLDFGRNLDDVRKTRKRIAIPCFSPAGWGKTRLVFVELPFCVGEIGRRDNQISLSIHGAINDIAQRWSIGTWETQSFRPLARRPDQCCAIGEIFPSWLINMRN